jgi:DNA-binding NarL/FixJ family response regulator
VRLLLADDHPLLLDRVASLLCSCFEVVGTARTGEELVSEALRLDPDVVVADVSMPVFSGIEAVHRLHQAGSRAKFIFLTVHSEEEFIRACMGEGALGYVVKSRIRTDLIPAINAAVEGQRYISQTSAR